MKFKLGDQVTNARIGVMGVYTVYGVALASVYRENICDPDRIPWGRLYPTWYDPGRLCYFVASPTPVKVCTPQEFIDGGGCGSYSQVPETKVFAFPEDDLELW